MITHVASFKRSIAVVIGINDYANGIPRLTTAVNDAVRLAAILQEAHGYEITLVVEAASHTRLTELFTETLPAQIEPDDRLLFYFAGHGIALDGDDGPQGYLIPQDARPEDHNTFLAMTEVHQWLAVLPCRHMLAILDCCFAGAFRWASLRNLQPLPTKLYRERYERFIRDPAWQVLTSAAYDQKALDVLNGRVLGERSGFGADKQSNSPFALALFEALAGAGDIVPKGTGDGVITASELYLYLRDFVEVQAEAQAHHYQTPGLWPLNKHDKGEFIFLVPNHALNLEPAPPLTTENNPYRGLKAYEEEHADLFFGRAMLVEKLVATVNSHPLTVVLGASGTGKSSLVKAGLLPYLRQNDDSEEHREYESTSKKKNEAKQGWYILPPIRPGEEPLDALTNSIAKLRAASVTEESEVSRGVGTAQAVHHDVEAWLEAYPSHYLLLVIDQFEELITLCREEVQRVQFQRTLADLLDHFPDRLHLVLTLRTDFEPQFAQSPLAGRWQTGRFIVPPMSQAELRTVIEGPAAMRVLFFDPSALIDALIDEVIQTPGALPLLSFTLEQLYLKYLKRQEAAQRSGDILQRSLIWADYIELGGVIGSLRTRADEEYDRLPNDAHRATMQRVMLRMVALEGSEVVRRRVTLSELIYPFDEENTRVQIVLNRLVDARLLVKGSTNVNKDGVPEPFVEPAHDALVAAWDRLLQWKRQAEESLPLQRRLWQAANEWEQAAIIRKTDLLWADNPRLPQIEALIWTTQDKQYGLTGRMGWLKQVLWPNVALPADTHWLNRAEVEFVQASITRRASGLRRVIVITISVIVALAGLAIVARLQANEATKQRDNAQRSAHAEATAAMDAREKQVQAERAARRARAGELAAYAQTELTSPIPDISLALLLSRAAVNTTLTTDGYSTPGASDILVTAISRAQYWRLTLPRHRHMFAVKTAVFSPDGHQVLTVGEDATLRIWDAANGHEILLLHGHSNRVNAAVFAPNGKQIASASDDETIRIWDAIKGQEILRLKGHLNNVRAVAFKPDGTRLVSAAMDGTSRIWDVKSGRELLVLRGHEASVNSATYSPDGQRIVTAGSDHTIRIWDANDGSQLLQLAGHGNAVNMAAYSPDGRTIISASDDGTARVWDASNGLEKLQLRGHKDGVWTAVYSPNGERIVTAGADTIVRVWNTQTGDEIIQLRGHRKQVLSAAYSADGRQIVTASSDWTARVWDAQTGQILVQMAGHADEVSSAALNPNGKRVVTASRDGTAWVWDVASGEVLRRFDVPGHLIVAAVFSPDGERVVTGDDEGTARVWDVASGKELLQLSGHTGDVLSVAYSLDGKHIATADKSGVAYIWDADNGKRLLLLEGHSEAIASIAFSTDGRRVVTASYDKTVRVWDGTYGDELLQLLGHIGPVLSAAFSPDGKRIVSAGTDNTARLWDAESGQEIRQLPGHGAWINNAVFSPNGSLIVTAGEDGLVRLWNAESGAELLSLSSHTLRVSSVAFSKDGRYLITADGDQTARLWQVPAQLAGSAATQLEVLQLQGHNGWVVTASYSPDGKRILTAGADGTARVWDAQNGSEMLRLDGHEGEWLGPAMIYSAAFSPDGKRIATGADDKTARIWDAESGKELLVLRTSPQDYVNAVVFSPDGRRVVTAGAFGIVHIWDAGNGQELLKFRGHHGDIWSVAYSPDGRRIISAGADQTIGVWDAETAQQLMQLKGHTGQVLTARFSPDGRRIVSASRDKTARVWDAESGQEVQRLQGHTSEVMSAAYSPDGRLIVTAGTDKTTRVWDTESGRELYQIGGHSEAVLAAAFSPNGQYLVTGSLDKSARIWRVGGATDADISSEVLPQFHGHTSEVLFAAYSPDGQRIVSASLDGTARIWEVSSGREMLRLEHLDTFVYTAVFSPDGRRVATGARDGDARIWDAQSGLELLKMQSRGNIWSVAFSPDGRRLATAADDGGVWIWDAESGRKLLQLQGHRGIVITAAFSPDGKRIVTASHDGTSRIWEAHSGQELFTLRVQTGGIWGAAFSPDGRRVVTAGGDGTARVWDGNSGRELRQLHGHALGVKSVAYSPDGKTIVTASLDNTVRVWEAETGTELLRFPGYATWMGDTMTEQGLLWLPNQRYWFNAADYSPDGRFIIAASNDQTVKVWPATAPALLKLAEPLIQRDPPLLTPVEQRLFGLD